MSLHSAIMKLTPETAVIDNDTIVTLKYNGKVYKGFAFCHREDADFYSEIIGTTIAHLRALIKIYDDEISRAEQTAITLWSAYKDVIYKIFSKTDLEINKINKDLKDSVKTMDEFKSKQDEKDWTIDRA